MGREVIQFIKDNDLYKVARITGPSHNFLAIRLSDIKCTPRVIAMPVKEYDVIKLEEKDVLAQVLLRLTEINRELKKTYFLSEIQFIPSDTEETSVYKLLTEELIRRIDSSGEFILV